MFVARVKSKGKDGKIYESILLRESIRKGSKVTSRTLAVLTKLPKFLIDSIEGAIKGRGSEARTPHSDCGNVPPPEPTPTDAIASLAQSASGITLTQKESFGAFWLVKTLADQIGISNALHLSNSPKDRRHSHDHDFCQIAILRVCARLLVPGISLLGLARFVMNSCAERLFSWKAAWTEDDLYQHHGTWLDARQNNIEKSLWDKKRTAEDPSPAKDDLFLYDVTSSYFEGVCNELSAFGYNRDGKRGKRQVVAGLLTDRHGDPCSIKLYSGETRDFDTFADALKQAKEQFGGRNVIMVGDRGMIKSTQIEAIKEAGGSYISSLTKPQINKLVRDGVFQLELFDEDIAEVIDPNGGERFVLRKNPVRADEMKINRKEREAALEKCLKKSNTYLQEHPGAKVEVQLKRVVGKSEKLRLQDWITIEKVPGKNELRMITDPGALAEEEKLDGCYAIRTNLSSEEYGADEVHERYKDLGEVEHDFRTMKTGHLELRPFFVRTEENTRAHALVTMLALKIRRHLSKCWKEENITVEEGLRHLESLSILSIGDGKGEIRELLPEPSELQAKLLKLAGVSLPKRIPPKQAASVVTRKELSRARK